MQIKWLLSLLLFAPANAFDQRLFVPFDQSQLAESSFFEQFLTDSLANSGWIKSISKKDNQHSYNGDWAIEASSRYRGFDDDYGLVLKSPSSHHAISYKLKTPIDNSEKDLVLQYEIKTQTGLECGGSYIKLLDAGFEPSQFNDKTPFQIMFGPDKCGIHDKVHFIINRSNPINGLTEEKHLTDVSESRGTQLSALYTLILTPTGDFQIRINGEVINGGNILTPGLFEPSILPSKQIEDPDAVEPEDWTKDEYIDDEDAVKPEDYDQLYAAAVVPDPEVFKPDDWLENESEFILDPFATKPELWDDEEDGKWDPPTILNPKCETASGCGKWEAPLIPNKNYKGPWIPPVVPNPAYKGPWTPPVIENPNYYEDKTPAVVKSIGGLGFELWSMETDILFDNIYLGHSIKEAELIGNTTFLPKLQLESKSLDSDKPIALHKASPPPKSFEELLESDDTSSLKQVYIFFVLVFKREILNIKDFWYDFNRDPLTTLLEDPLKALVYAGVFVFGFTFVFGLVSVLSFTFSTWISETKKVVSDVKTEVQQKDPKIVEITDEEVEVLASGIEQKEVMKRRGNK